jgi:hypothetical protein
MDLQITTGLNQPANAKAFGKNINTIQHYTKNSFIGQ